MSSTVHECSIEEIQGSGFESPLAGRAVKTRGVVSGYSRRGFFIQDPNGKNSQSSSCGLFVHDRRERPPLGATVILEGLVVDYQAHEDDKAVTQLKLARCIVQEASVQALPIVWLDADTLPKKPAELASFLNSHEGMLCGVKAGAVFIAPSNAFADYVVLPQGYADDAVRSEHGGVLLKEGEQDPWYPSFRLVDYAQAMTVDVGSRLESDVVGPLNYRAEAWQLAVSAQPKVSVSTEIAVSRASLSAGESSISVMTMNALNLDAKVERKERVHDARRDIDDDQGDGRFKGLAKAVVSQAGSPDVIALQEIQDNDGAELGDVVDAGDTYRALIAEIGRLDGPAYEYCDIPPEAGQDGGQPGGNIRNGFLFNPKRVELVAGSMIRLGEEHSAFEDSRKPLLAVFKSVGAKRYRLAVVNVHLASKRQQRGVFSPKDPGHDPRLGVRCQQAAVIVKALRAMDDIDLDYFVTGDFNDSEFSEPLKLLCDEGRRNLVMNLAENERYDYNHRGKLQVLMHGIVSARQASNRTEYEILHGNELLGIAPGRKGQRASDHAYTICVCAPE